MRQQFQRQPLSITPQALLHLVKNHLNSCKIDIEMIYESLELLEKGELKDTPEYRMCLSIIRNNKLNKLGI
jgi:hypothetical protein